MPFFNQYIRENGAYKYLHSLKIGNAVYSAGREVIGETESRGTLQKLDLSGNVVWEKSFMMEGGLDFTRLLACTGNSDFLVLGSSKLNETYYIFRFSSDGAIIWKRKLANSFPASLSNTTNFHYFIDIGDESYVMAATEHDTGNTRIFRFNGSGVITASRTLSSTQGYQFEVAGVVKGPGKIALYGTSVNKEKRRKGTILEIDLGLTTVLKRIDSDSNYNELGSPVRDMFYKGSSIIAHLHYEVPFFVKFNATGSSVVMENSRAYFPGPHISSLKYNSTHIYLEEYTFRDQSVITKMTHDFEAVWTKKFVFEYQYATGILFDVTDQNLVINTGESVTPDLPKNVALLDLNMTSCKTSDLEVPFLDDKGFLMYISDNPYYFIDWDNKLVDPSGVEVININSIVKVVCDNLNPCIKDTEFCAAYIKLSKSFYDCIQKVSENQSFPPKYSAYKTCFNTFVKSLQELANAFPQYSIIPNLFYQLEAIKAFSGSKPDSGQSAYYYAAMEAVAYIFEYLSTLGNCSCENTLDLTDYASIQSGNLYLQAAGSVGADSTKGIHLRWAFRGALVDHLPKADYATTNFNFNKPNDYVRVYRTPYAVKPVVLNLGQQPAQIVEAPGSKFWLYEVSGKFFHVHFRDNAKYTQVRNSLNPTDDPLGFIAQYGNSLIEIENKTELSFTIRPVFEVTSNADYVMVEVLSVLENKITADKTTSLRKKYTVADLNDKPLVSENIRSIRFKATGAYPVKFGFEFYSNSILAAKDANAWQFMGKYALTRETSTAFQRLEPIQHCLDPWLRYNDLAYVNVDNYKHKWNGSDVDPMERILTAVGRYIDLSDAADNIRAIEYFPYVNQGDAVACNMEDPDYNTPGYEPAYDPYIPEDTDTPTATANSIEISYLDTLNMGALDYHIARMVGLGTLDLSKQAVEGVQYLYLAEYITFADLEDGLGAREVQHLYCSLPTSLRDQRLCIPVDLKEPIPGFFFSGNGNGQEIDEGDEEGDGENIPADPYASVDLTEDGYSPDGRTRYYSLFPEQEPEEPFNAPFYFSPFEFISAEHTPAVFAGLEYRDQGASAWAKPELSYDPEYFNIDTSGTPPDFTNETVSLIIPDPGFPLYTHAVKQSGDIEYSSYGINWFSRAVSSDVIWPVHTELKPAVGLLPPGNITATLIQKENPLLLTSAYEQTLFKDNPHADSTLVRLTFEYNTAQELIDYHQKNNDEMVANYSELDNSKELFAENIQIFFRNRVPDSISGQISNVISNDNPLLLVVETAPYVFASNNESIVPVVPTGTAANFIGSIMLVDNVQYVVQEVDTSSTYPKFTIFKADASGALIDENSTFDPEAILINPTAGSLFAVVENMQNESAWGVPNPMPLYVNIDLDDIHREDGILYKNLDCSTETHVQKFRGVYKQATVEKVLEKVDENGDIIIQPNPAPGTYTELHLGLYKITFNIPEGSVNGFSLPQHSQYHLQDTHNGLDSVEWYNGTARLHVLSPVGKTERKNFKVVSTENIGTSNNLVIYIQDPTFPTDPTQLNAYAGNIMPPGNTPESSVQYVNYYPGYKVYLYENAATGLQEANVLPTGDDDVRYTIFGLRSHDNDKNLDSKLSVPALMFAQANVAPMQPELPLGGKYATRPDYFGKASYTFRTKYGTPTNHHKPYAVQFSRASDIQLLGAVYNNTPLGYTTDTREPILNTVEDIMQNIFLDGEEEYYINRWNDFLSFDHPDGFFSEIDGKTMPIPDNPDFIRGINDFIHAHNAFYNLVQPDAEDDLPADFNLSTVVIHASPQNDELTVMDFFRDVIFNCFVPLTEIPIIYNYVNGSTYKPIPKKQVIRDRNGELLKPEDPLFDMAPMMKRIDPAGSQYESQFTDFGLDGASNAKYFYVTREFNIQMKASDYSPIAGPISLVNTAPPIAPEIVKTLQILENRRIGTPAEIQLKINVYPKAQNIAKASVYRAINPSDALSVRTMDLIRVYNLEDDALVSQNQWTLSDDFSDLPQVPYGDPIFYRITVSRKIRYNDKDLVEITEYAPSEASKLIVTNINENYSPESPVLKYTAGDFNPATDSVLNYVTFSWNETCYKGNYHLYKMTNQGNWIEIGRVMARKDLPAGTYEVYNQDVTGNWVNTVHPGTFQSVGGNLYLQMALTDLATGQIEVKSPDGTPVYHHFKVIAENTSGLLSTTERRLTLYDPASYQSDGGIAPDNNPNGMIVEGTFIVRPD